MRYMKKQNAFSLIEMLVVLTVISILTGLVIHSATSFDRKAKVRLCEGALAQIDLALAEFNKIGFTSVHADYRFCKFPVDCQEPAKRAMTTVIEEAMDYSNVSITGNLNDYSIAVMYFVLEQQPACKEILARMDESVVSNLDDNGNVMNIQLTRNGTMREYAFFTIRDPWGKALSYDYYRQNDNVAAWSIARRSFPVVTSAGPDGNFGTSDDITNR
jgi:prepilin-type N-terminal cleavage/methylation domain-containing protein